MRRPSAAAAALAAALAAAGACAGGAHAAGVVVDGDTLTYRADAGERNVLSINQMRAADLVSVRDGGVAKLVDRGVVGCRPAADPNELHCRRSGLRRIRVELGDGNDSFISDQPLVTTIDAGPGDDLLTATGVVADRFENLTPVPAHMDFTGGTGRDLLRFITVESHLTRPTDPGVRVTKNGLPDDGRPFDRVNVRPDIEGLEGTSRNDVLAGGPGPDLFVSTRGADTLDGGDGDDRFDMGAVKDGATRAIGGGGRDTATYARRAAPVRASVDLPNLFDGEAGEEDQLEGVDVVEGGSAADVLLTRRETAVGYRLIGGPGDDSLAGGDGRDRLIGGPGEDVMFSFGRADVIEARDGARDRIDCGTNGDDTAYVDHREAGTRGCETVFRPQLSFLGGPVPAPR